MLGGLERRFKEFIDGARRRRPYPEVFARTGRRGARAPNCSPSSLPHIRCPPTQAWQPERYRILCPDWDIRMPSGGVHSRRVTAPTAHAPASAPPVKPTEGQQEMHAACSLYGQHAAPPQRFFGRNMLGLRNVEGKRAADAIRSDRFFGRSEPCGGQPNASAGWDLFQAAATRMAPSPQGFHSNAAAILIVFTCPAGHPHLRKIVAAVAGTLRSEDRAALPLRSMPRHPCSFILDSASNHP